MAGRTSYYGGIVLDGLVFHIDAAKQESYAKRGLRYTQNGNTSLFVDFADTSKISSSKNASGSVINGATFSNFTPYHLSDYTSPYWYNPGNMDMISTDTRNSSPVWTTLEHSWDANGDANDSKGSAHGIIVTPVGQTFSTSTMTYQSGKVGSAFSFNGSNFISLPENTLKFTTYIHPYEYPRDFSVSLWFYVPAGLTDSYLISSFHNTGDYTEYNGWGITYNNTTKSINFFIGIKMGAPGNPGSQYYSISLTTGNNAFQVNQWNHVLVTRKVNTRSRIYVNGVLSASDTNIYDPSYHSYPNLSYIGASYYAFSVPFYTAAPAGLKIDIVQTFTSELDSVSAGELYTMSNLYSSVAFNNTGIGTSYGNIEFDGVDDYINFGDTPDITGCTDITVSTWFYVNKFRPSMPGVIGTTSVVAGRYSNITPVNGWDLGYNNDGTVWFGGRESSAEYIQVTASLLIKQANMNGVTANGGWYNAVGIKKGNEWSISVMDTNVSIDEKNARAMVKSTNNHTGMRSVTAGLGNVPFGTNNLYAGKSQNSFFMNGRLMTLSVYNRALSLAEINQNYNSFSKRILKLNMCPDCVAHDVTIGTQIWTGCNATVETYEDGTIIPQVTNAGQWASLTTGAWCYYNNDPANAQYGKLYNWYAVAGIHDAASLSNPALRKKLAPTGYHVPSNTEFSTLFTTVGGGANAGFHLREPGTCHWVSTNNAMLNTYDFSALGGGIRDWDNVFRNLKNFGWWWTSQGVGTANAFYYSISASGQVNTTTFYSYMGMSVRFIKD